MSQNVSQNPSPSPASPPQVVLLTRDKDCKHSVRYSTKDFDAPVSSVYLSRKFSQPMPTEIEISIKGVR